MAEVEKKMVKLLFGVYGEGSIFSLETEGTAKVKALQNAIFDDQRYDEHFSFPPSALTLYLAKKDGAWLEDDDNADVLLQGKIDTAYKKMRPAWALNDNEYFGDDFLPGYKEIHILVELPETATAYASGERGSECIVQDTPHPHRVQRWNKINSIIARNSKKIARTTEEGFTTSYSSSRWTAVGPVFDEDWVKYVETIRPIPASDLKVLSQVLTWNMTWFMKCYDWTLIDVKDNEAKRLHMIAPILWSVVQLLPDVTIYNEVEFYGDRVDAHGHFEFVLVRGDKCVCIVVAKEEKFKEGMAQALLGCEVAADLDHSHEVYAVVTNVEKWIFLKSLDEEILCDEFNALTFDENGSPHADQLNEVTGKLHSMLTTGQQPAQ